MKSLANEYAQRQLLVTNVCPGYTQTARLDDLAGKLAAAEGVDPRKSESDGPRKSP